MRNNSVDFECGLVVQEISLKTFLSRALAATLFLGGELFVQFW